MEQLPVELLTRIFKVLTKRDWLSLSQTCATIGSVAQSLLYKEVILMVHETILDENCRYSGDSVNAKTYELFSRSMENTRLAGLVGTLILQFPISGSSVTHPTPPDLSHFVNLHTLFLRGFRFETNLSNSLSGLVSLRLIHLDSCHFNVPVPHDYLEKIPTCPSLAMVITQGVLGDGWQTLVPHGLKSLGLETDMEDREDNLLELMEPLRDSLRQLNFSKEVPANIIPLLLTCSQLRCIGFSCYTLNDSDVITSLNSLPPRAIPLLEDFSGHAEYAEAFIRDRPVHSAAIYFGEETPADALRALELSTVSISKLSVHNRDIFYALPIPIEISQYVPTTLKYFGFGIQFASWVSDLLPVLSKMPDLRVIGGWCVEQDDRYTFRHRLVHAASEICVSLEEVVFDIDPWSVDWQETWFRGADGVWTFDQSWMKEES